MGRYCLCSTPVDYQIRIYQQYSLISYFFLHRNKDVVAVLKEIISENSINMECKSNVVIARDTRCFILLIYYFCNFCN